VVKNFADKTIDDYLYRHNVKVINTDKQTIGEKLVIGIINSSAEILCFLEDDDLFSSTKLSAVLKLFLDKDVVFLRNDYELVDANLNKILKKDYKHLHESYIIDNSLRNFKLFKKLYDMQLYHGLSNMSIRKTFVQNYLEYLQYI
jgi:glycosyltransferase involved in cell wall biosynthesis